MKNKPTILAAVFVALVLLTYMCTFEVRSTEVAIIKTMGRPAQEAIRDPGLKLKLPWPIQSVVTYDNRKRILLDKTEETGTRDEKNVILSTYTVWQIVDPSKFHENFPNEQDGVSRLRTLVQTCKNQEVGKHLFAEFVSLDENERNLRTIEKNILETLKRDSQDEYGVEVIKFGIRKLTLPEAVTQTIFASMKATQEAKAQNYVKEGEARATEIKASARATEQRILAAAQERVSRIDAEGQRIVSEYYKEFDQYPELRIFLDQLQGATNALRSRATIILDTNKAPFDLFNEDFLQPVGRADRDGAAPGPPADADDSQLTRAAQPPS